MKYRIALHQSDEGYSVSVSGLPGCWSQGATEKEAIENIRDAIREYLSVVKENQRRLLKLCGTGGVRKGYDYKRARPAS
jgi:predicted RNase H-like HicB family nuclease